MAAVDLSSYECNREYTCRWPNGEVQRVMLTKVIGAQISAAGVDDTPYGKVIWNENLGDEDEPNIIGMDATVPLAWLDPVDPSAPSGLEPA
jgi:hypothetical protein